MIHPELVEKIVSDFGERLTAPPSLTLDAITLFLDNDVVMAARFSGPAEYSIRWRWGEMECGIDTAPCHPHLATFPNHLHDDMEKVVADPLTSPDRSPWDNLRAVISAVLADPLLQSQKELGKL